MFLCLGVAGARADEYDVLRLKWRDLITLGTNVQPANPLYSSWVSTIAADAQREWDKLNTNTGRTWLWQDLQTPGPASGDLTSSYERLRRMAMGWAVQGSALQGNAALRTDIINALDWLYTNAYNEATAPYDNFFDWEIGSPLNLVDLTVLLYDHLTSGQITRYMNTVNTFTPAPSLTGANLVWQCVVVGVRGAVVRNGAKISAARLALSDVFPYVGAGDGFYAEGSFVFHTYFPYTSGYGSELLANLVPLLEWLQGSTWEVTDPARTNVVRWVYDSFEPFLQGGAMMQMVSGRYYTRDGDDHQDGHEVLGSILRLARTVSPAEAASLRGLVKREILGDTYRDFVTQNFPPYDVWGLEVVNDTNLAPRPPLVGHRQFPRMDMVVHRRPGWSLALSMSSRRIANYESTRGENLRGWYLSDGATFLYNDDLAHYADGYWPAFNPYRVPGTTVDTQVRTNGSGASYRSPNHWVGGASLPDSYGVAGMQLRAWNSTLSARKSWFFLDDEVVCLGADIVSTDGRPIETVVENRRLAALGDNPLTVNGQPQPDQPGWASLLSAVTTVHLTGNVPGTDLGYFFPSAANVQAVREVRAGSYADLNPTYGSTNRLARNFLTLTLDHGINPTNGSYAYVLLPNRSAAQVSTYAVAPDIAIVENTSRAQAVREQRLGITAVNFWRDSTNRVAGITSDRRAAVIQRNDGTCLQVAVADPTQTNTGSITIELTGVGQAILSADPTITVLQLSPTIRLAVNVAGSLGASHRASFFVASPALVNLSPVADAYVQNGDQTNANFGASASLAVKASATSLGRESFLRFDLRGLSGRAFNATLRLLPFTTNEPIEHALAPVTDDAWTETGLTWNNKPVSGSEWQRWNVPVAGTPVLLPVLPLVEDARAGDGLLSFRVYSTGTPPPGGSYVAYGSKENGASGNRPQLQASLGRYPPTVSLVEPVADSVQDAPAAVFLSASAVDSDGVVTNVTFYAGASLLGQDATAPFTLTWPGVGPGRYTVTAVARDATGLMATSGPVTFTVSGQDPVGRGTGLVAEYYSNSDLTGLITTRIDALVDFDWGNGKPLPNAPPNGFSIRWLGKLQARKSGPHAFHVAADDRARLWIAGQLVTDTWSLSSAGEASGTVTLAEGEYYDLLLEYQEIDGPASVSLAWTQPGVARQAVPQAQLYPADEGLRASYHAGTSLSSLVFTRMDDQVDFQWGDGSPDPILLPGSFSVRWTGRVRARQAGTYAFHTVSDDGVRLYVNNQLLIDDWNTRPLAERTATIALAAGQTYNLTLDYLNQPGGAAVTLAWTPPGEGREVIPRASLTPHQNNRAPVLDPIPGFTAAVGSLCQFTARARDLDVPAHALSYSLDAGAPAGATVDPATGVVSWTPSAGQGGSSHTFAVRVTDSGVPAMTDAQWVTISVVSNGANAAVSLIATGSQWRYLDSGSDPGPLWRERAFDDGGWSFGQAPLGYGQGDEGTILSFGPNPAAKPVTVWFRRQFVVPDVSRVYSLAGRLLRNDGAAVYLNGAEIWRENLPPGPLTSSTLALTPVDGAGSAGYLLASFNPGLLLPGTNVVAVELHQHSPSGPDLRFDLELTGTALVPDQVRVTLLSTPGGLELRWPWEAGLLQPYAASTLAAPIPWQRLSGLPSFTNDSWVLPVPPAAQGRTWFRLQAP
jgi:hyaluronate lyase